MLIYEEFGLNHKIFYSCEHKSVTLLVWAFATCCAEYMGCQFAIWHFLASPSNVLWKTLGQPSERVRRRGRSELSLGANCVSKFCQMSAPLHKQVRTSSTAGKKIVFRNSKSERLITQKFWERSLSSPPLWAKFYLIVCTENLFGLILFGKYLV
jgi:hypothetical protein